MSTYLYRAICLETVDDEFADDLMLWPGLPLGRSSGYLSRSSAVAAGEGSGVKYVIVRSEPIVFPVPLVLEQALLIDELRDKLARTPTG